MKGKAPHAWRGAQVRLGSVSNRVMGVSLLPDDLPGPAVEHEAVPAEADRARRIRPVAESAGRHLIHLVGGLLVFRRVGDTGKAHQRDTGGEAKQLLHRRFLPGWAYITPQGLLNGRRDNPCVICEVLPRL